MIGDSVLTMTKYNGSQKRYNLEDVSTYDPVVNVEPRSLSLCEKLAEPPENAVVRLPMPARSLMVLYGSAR